MRYLAMLLILGLVLTGLPARAADPGSVWATGANRPAGRVGLLPERWVVALERNNLSERSVVILGAAAATAIGVGAFAGPSVGGGAAGGILLAGWLAHLPFHVAYIGGIGYAAYSFFWPKQPSPPMQFEGGPRISISHVVPVR